jgi:hypothetical protein
MQHQALALSSQAAGHRSADSGPTASNDRNAQSILVIERSDPATISRDESTR